MNMKKLIQKKLGFLAKRIIKKYKPKVVVVTGSVGKTSTKDAIFAVLHGSFPERVRKSKENYNNELGLPFTIIGVEAPGRNVVQWFKILWKAWCLILKRKRNYPRVLVLEMAADRPGDIEYLVKIAPPDVAVVSAVGPSHLEFFSSLEAIQEEKEKLVRAVPPGGLIVLNRNDERVSKMRGQASILKYGLAQDEEKTAPHEIVASHIQLISPKEGLRFKLHYKGNIVPVHLPQIIARHHIYAALAAVAVGTYFKIHLIKSAESLKNFTSPPGRMRIISGIKQSLIIDDTYNAAPASTIAALRTLGELGEACFPVGEGRRKVAILGDMLELGPETERGHRQVGQVARELVDLLITVGDRANFTSAEARQAGMPEDQIIEYNYTDEVLDDMENIIEPNDLILVKGSQAMRMEKIVKDIMMEPLRAEELLVRQSEEWQNS